MRYLRLQDSDEKSICYEIADSLYHSDSNIDGLEYLIQAHQSLKTTKKPQPPSNNLREIYHQSTPIGERCYSLKVMIDDKDYHIQVGSDRYKIGKEGISADISNIDMTILMGPVFILHLAKNQVFCLHASAFLLFNTCFILMADSGTGKSTIAKYVDQNHLGQRLADDIVPLKITNDSVNLLGNFPQLKLSQEQQYKGDNIRQKTILLFAKKSKSETSVKKIDRFKGMKKLIKHSVATKLFAENELNNHLKFCHETSERTLSYQIKYQHSKNSLPQLTEVLNGIV